MAGNPAEFSPDTDQRSVFASCVIFWWRHQLLKLTLNLCLRVRILFQVLYSMVCKETAFVIHVYYIYITIILRSWKGWLKVYQITDFIHRKEDDYYLDIRSIFIFERCCFLGTVVLLFKHQGRVLSWFWIDCRRLMNLERQQDGRAIILCMVLTVSCV